MDVESRSSPAQQLDALCQVLEHRSSGNVDSVGQELGTLLGNGDCANARVLLDAAELRLGPWLGEGGNQAAKAQLGEVHLLVLLCENDLPAAKMLIKRLGGQLTPVLTKIAAVYDKLWNTQLVAAMEIANSCKQDSAFARSHLVARALDLFLARIRLRQLYFIQRAYSCISAEKFGKVLGFSTMEEVDNFCRMSPSVFELKNGFVVARPPAAVDNTEVASQIEKLTKLIVFLEGETVMHIDPKLPGAAAGASGSSQM